MYPEQFLVDDVADPMAPSQINLDLVNAVLANRDIGVSDVEAASALLRLAHDELESYGTDGMECTDDSELRLMLRASMAVLSRLGIGWELPFRDYKGVRTFWMANDGYGSWQARRDILVGLFDSVHLQLSDLEDAEIMSGLADPITSHSQTGWVRVDVEIKELRRHFQVARTEQDYRNVGNDCVAVLERLSAAAYDPSIHLREGETEPPVASTKQRLERCIEVALEGSENQHLRKLARAVIEVAQTVRHRGSPSRTDAGIAADAVIQLANMLRRLDDVQPSSTD
ncbi:MAG: hypothetical protein ABJH68_20745 [Ilumatobacter sp.]|uniref:hypothetical protein n=1 Tax=Ilumatobacter sp. TaxID=1967498 RepID=UPI003296CFE8